MTSPLRLNSINLIRVTVLFPFIIANKDFEMGKKRIGLLAAAMVLLVVFSAVAQEDNKAGQIPPELNWPKVINTPEATITIYQPQLESFEGNRLTSRFATSLQSSEREEPVFGAVWVEAGMETQRDERMVRLISIETVRSRFPNAKPEEEKWFADVLKKEIPSWDISLSIDQIVAGLDSCFLVQQGEIRHLEFIWE